MSKKGVAGHIGASNTAPPNTNNIANVGTSSNPNANGANAMPAMPSHPPPIESSQKQKASKAKSDKAPKLKSSKADKADKTAKSSKAEKADRGDKGPKAEKSDKSEKVDKQEKAKGKSKEKAEKVEKRSSRARASKDKDKSKDKSDKVKSAPAPVGRSATAGNGSIVGAGGGANAAKVAFGSSHPSGHSNFLHPPSNYSNYDALYPSNRSNHPNVMCSSQAFLSHPPNPTHAPNHNHKKQSSKPIYPSSSKNQPPFAFVHNIHPAPLDPLLLGRGISARYLSTKVMSHSSPPNSQKPNSSSQTNKKIETSQSSQESKSNQNPSNSTQVPGTQKSHQLTALSKDQVDKDLRHFEAYRNACNAYSQQLFVYNNQELCRSGYFGMVVPLGGKSVGDEQDPVIANRMPPSLHPVAPTSSMLGPTSMGPNGVGSTSSTFPFAPFALPSKIDPEHEKRLLLLRKKIHQSEHLRSKLETEYLSLRAHYVHQSQLVRKTRAYEVGRWKLLRELLVRRGRVLGCKRAKVAVGRDIERVLRGRGRALGLLEETKEEKEEKPAAGVGLEGNKSLPNSQNNGDSPDLLEIWNNIEIQLKEAELACMELDTPPELLQMMLSPDEPISSVSGFDDVNNSNDGHSHGYRTRSPTRKIGNDDDNKNKGSDKSEKEKNSGGSKRRSRSGSFTSVEDSSEGGNSNANESKRTTKNVEPNMIPWDSIVEPSTPFEIPLVLSCLGLSTDKCVGILTNENPSDSITFLRNALPQTTAEYSNDADDVVKLREEARLLMEELKKETERNTELQKQMSRSRERNDEMVAMMQLLRSETEAVLERHNLILETPEARKKAAELHRKLVEEEKQNALAEENAARNRMGDEEDDRDQDEVDGEEGEDHEEGEIDENEEQDDFSQDEEDSAEEGEIQEDDEENDGDDEDEDEEEPVQIKEVIVKSNGNVLQGDSDVEGEEEDENLQNTQDGREEGEEDEEEEGEIIEDDDAEEGEIEEDTPRSSGGKHSRLEDEESSNLSPDPNSFKKRRRAYEERGSV